MIRAPKPPPGYVDRGMLMPAYPTPEQVAKIEAMQPSLRACWNWLVSRIEEPLKAREAKAVREGLIEPPIPRPCYEGLQLEEAKALKQEYVAKCKDRSQRLREVAIPVEWRPHLSGPGSEAERLGLKQGYQVLNNYLANINLPTLPAQILLKLQNNFELKFSGQFRKKTKSKWDVMPIQVSSGPTIRLKKVGLGETWHIRRCNAEIYLVAVGWIAVYLDKFRLNTLLTPGNYARQGCTLRYQQGSWEATINVVRRELYYSGPNDSSSVGIDPGLVNLATVSDGYVLKNPRNLLFNKNKAIALSISDSIPDNDLRQEFRRIIFRQEIKQTRRVLTQCRQLAAKLSRQYDFIGIESNSGIALGIGSGYKGATKLLLRCLLLRCGHNRIKEVDSCLNSQSCSNCGHLDKETWVRKLGQKEQICKCLKCGYIADRDINAAINVHSKLKRDLVLP